MLTPRVSGPVRVVLLLGISATLCLASHSARPSRRARRTASRSLLTPECKQYDPEDCALVHGDGPARVPFCHKGDGVPRECDFDRSVLTDCPLPTRGKFAPPGVGRTEGICESAFMVSKRTSTPMCGPHCCTADFAGGFHPAKRRHLRQQSLEFQPSTNSCRYHEYNWREAMDCLAGSHLVIAGDSIMRQLFNAGIALFRGQIGIDYNKHAHGKYRVCETADSLAFGSFRPERFEVPLAEVEGVFGAKASTEVDDSCGKASTFELDYLWAPKYSDLTANLLEFHKKVALGSGLERERLSYVVFAGFWEDQQSIPADFLDALETVRAAAKTLILVGVPRTRLFGWKKDNARIRNEKTREWAVARSTGKGGNVLYLDFDNLAQAQNAPEAIGSLNWHYQCFLDHAHLAEAEEELGGLQGAWHWPGILNYTYPSLWTDDAAKCRDDMDRTVWQILFNLLCNRRGAHVGSRHSRPAALGALKAAELT